MYAIECCFWTVPHGMRCSQTCQSHAQSGPSRLQHSQECTPGISCYGMGLRVLPSIGSLCLRPACLGHLRKPCYSRTWLRRPIRV